MNVYEFDKDLLASIGTPRVHHQLVPNEVSIIIIILYYIILYT